MQPNAPGLESVTVLPRLPPRPADSNKGTFGRVLVVAGSRGMSGAAILCGSAALRGGAGLVFLVVPQSLLDVVAGFNPCYLTVPLDDDPEGRLASSNQPNLRDLIAKSTVVACGPGIGRGPGIAPLVRMVLAESKVPVVLDADGLNALAEDTDWLNDNPAPRVLTPHPGEFARLMHMDIPTVQARRQELAVGFAARHRVVLLLKGHETIVTDGRRVYVNRTGNPGMATGGTGDVLTGLIAALIGQGLAAFEAAQLGAWWHGRAGDLARDDLGETCLIASDLLDYLPQALRDAPG